MSRAKKDKINDLLKLISIDSNDACDLPYANVTNPIPHWDKCITHHACDCHQEALRRLSRLAVAIMEYIATPDNEELKRSIYWYKVITRIGAISDMIDIAEKSAKVVEYHGNE